MGVQIWAADVTGRIRGTVTDPSGAVVANIPVTATNVQTGAAYTAKSNSTGGYEFLQLPVGTYNISATAAGFQTFAANGIKLNLDQVYVQPIQFQVGQETQTVEVNANAVQVDTTNMQLNNVVEAKQIVDLPLIGRNWTQLEQLQPGVQSSSDRFGTFSVNGAQTQQTSFLINGTDVNDLPLNTTQYTPSPDALSEFNLITSSLNPEYSRNSGAIVSASIKSGTNAYHGDAFDFYRDTFLNNHNFFQKTAPKFHQNIFGGTLGGPVLKDKAFFFLSYQGTRAVQPQTVGTNTVFSQAQLGGDWTTLANGKAFALKDRPIPGTLLGPTGCPAGSTWSSCFPTGIIPASAFNPLAVKLAQQFVPLPNGPNNTFIFNPQTTTVQDQGIARIDGNVTSKDQLWGLMVFEHRPTSDTLPFTGSTLPGFGDVSTRETHQFTADWNHVFSPTTLNEFRLGYSRFNFGAVSNQQIVQPSSLGFAITPQHPEVAGAPKISVPGFFTLGFSNNGPQPRIDQNYQVDDNFSKIVGNHSLKFGFDGRRFNVNNPFFNGNNGVIGFSSSNSFGTGSAGLDFLLGDPSGYSQGGGGVVDAYAYELYPYAQDVWKARENLTLTYGLGWQIDGPLHNLQHGGEGVTCYVPGEQSKIFPTAPTSLVYPGDPGCTNAQGSRTMWRDFGPRVGFAYSPDFGFLSGEHKLSIRGGYGIYYNRTEEETSLQNLGQPPFGINSSGANHYVPGAHPGFVNPFQDIDTGIVYANQFPAPVVQAGQAVDFSPLIPFVSSLSQYGPDFRIPYSQNINLTLQRELPSNIVATVSYVAALGRHEQSTYNPDPITPAGHAACLADTVNCSGTSPSNTSPNIDNQAEKFPGHVLNNDGDVFASPGFVGSGGTSNYNALQISAKKGMTHGLLFQASYTYSHSLDTASSFENSGFGGSVRGFNQFDPGLNYGDSAFDVRHRFVFSPVYDIPFRHNGFLGRVLGGWEINGILTLSTGFPYDISYGGGVSYSLWCAAGENFYACPDIPNQTGPLQLANPRTGGATNSHWFTPGTTFTDEALGSFGNIHRNPFHGPGIINTDVGLYKNLFLTESKYIQLRLESYNVFNHTNFNNPDGNFLDSTFGQITSAAAGRQTQLAAKFYF
ncbi:MAG TPA: carboxypeptidase-like regulatory domain-containing protein [Terriglobales bacterium]|nr:carboxypeptidase-like regulatory domain-containing protein [Terriglobales bacterium]